jgi:hypothetical protein
MLGVAMEPEPNLFLLSGSHTQITLTLGIADSGGDRARGFRHRLHAGDAVVPLDAASAMKPSDAFAVS